MNRYSVDPNYDLYQLALKSTAKRIYPNYVNCDWSVQKEWIEKDREMREHLLKQFGEPLVAACKEHPEWMDTMRICWSAVSKDCLVPVYDVDPLEEASTMGCRTQNGYNINAEAAIKRNYQAIIDGDFDEKFDGIFSAAQRDGRGNIAPQTIVLPEVAMRAIHSCDDGDFVSRFFEVLNDALNDTCESLKYRFDLISGQDASIAPFMYKNKTMIGYHPDEGIVTALRNGTLAVGMLGMSECLKILIGTDQTTKPGMALAKQILGEYNMACGFYKKKYSLNYAPYYAPAESTAGKAMEHFKKKWGSIDGITDHDYFTNSIHVPVWYECSPFEKIDIESQITHYGTAGVITYVELESSIQNNLDALETIVDYAMDNDVPYFAINVPVDECVDCGWMEEIDVWCPVCGSDNIRRLRRLTGYLGADIPNANKWKQAEFADRVKHQI